jgi:hypothetical protein
MVKSINKLATLQENLKKSTENFDMNGYVNYIYSYDQINKETESFAQNAAAFADSNLSSETSRHNYELSCVVVIPVLTLISLIGYFRNKSVVILIMSILLSLLIIPSLIIEGINSCHFILSVDMCKNINKHILEESYPIPGKGLGKYISCPSKPIQFMINTARFDLGNSFNYIYDSMKKHMTDKYSADIGNLKRDNKLFTELAEKYKDDNYLNSGLISLTYLNDILLGLEGLITCNFAEDVVNYTEETFCYKNITYQFKNLFYYILGIFGLFILVIGVNKLIVLLSPAFVRIKTKKTGMESLNDTV